MILLGKLGFMIAGDLTSKESVSRGHEQSVFNSMGGYTSRQVAVWRSPRVWSVGWDLADLHVAGGVRALLDAYGPGPFQFRPMQAASLNLLTPEAASLDPRGTDFNGGIASLGPVVAADGTVLHRQVTSPAASSTFLGRRTSGDWILTPLRAGRRVTASVYARGSQARLQVVWTDAAGAWVGTPSLSPVGAGSDGEYRRLTVSATPPAGAVAVRLAVAACTGAAHAAITETPDVKPWAPGEGVAQVSVTGYPSTDLAHVSGQGTFGSMSMEITEDMV